MRHSFSIVIPARNEEKHVGGCLESIAQAAAVHGARPEVIVVLNRCTDGTGEVARAAGACTVVNDSRSLSAIRNAGAQIAACDILATIDADSRMSKNMLVEIDRALGSGRFIGGGVPIRPERMSLGIFLTGAFLLTVLGPLGISAGMFWCFRRDFEAMGGFDERIRVAEDIDFATRLKAYGREQGKRYGTLRRAHIVTSCRKFDHFGDWFGCRMLFQHPGRVLNILRGQDDGMADEFFYDFRH